MTCFVDTSAFAALYNRKDAHHCDAKQIWTTLRCQNATLYTSHDIIAETVILIRRRIGFHQAVVCGDDLWDSPVLEILRSDTRQDREAWELFQKYQDKELSFVDCLSFIFMKELSIRQAFSFDSHFTQVGFDVLKV